MQEIPVYLFTGFLESGKTLFIQETLEDVRFNSGERTLVIMCEEGIEELSFSRFSSTNVYVELIEDESDFNETILASLVEKHKAERVLIEYNGMWPMQTLFDQMPLNWVIYQEFTFADAHTFLAYNQNMRQLVYDKLQSADVVVFNRWDKSFDKMPYHKIVRGASRRSQIMYETPDREAEPDDIEDPLPFDLNAPIIKIEDRDYAYWYRDMGEEMDNYDNKKVCFKAITANSQKLPDNTFVVGRKLMSCCVEDIQMAGLACVFNEKSEGMSKKPNARQWYMVTAEIRIEKNEAYGTKAGPVMHILKLESADAPEEEVATYY